MEHARMRSPSAVSHSQRSGSPPGASTMVHHRSSSLHSIPATPVLYVQKDTEDVVRALAEYVRKAQKIAVEKKGRFTVALSGGSLPKNLRGLIGMDDIHWDKW